MNKVELSICLRRKGETILYPLCWLCNLNGCSNHTTPTDVVYRRMKPNYRPQIELMYYSIFSYVSVTSCTFYEWLNFMLVIYKANYESILNSLVLAVWINIVQLKKTIDWLLGVASQAMYHRWVNGYLRQSRTGVHSAAYIIIRDD